MQRIKAFLLFWGILFALNVTFVALHYIGDLTPVDKAIFRIKEGVDHLNIVQEDYPTIKYGLCTNYVLVGMDQLTDCNIVYQMSIYRGDNKLRNAIVPGIAEPSAELKKTTHRCERAIGLATGKIAIDKDQTETKARLWHGAKAVFLLLVPIMDIFQMREFIQLTTYFLYAVIAMIFSLQGLSKLIIFLPFAIFGIIFSGIPYFSDLSNGLPYMVVLLGIAFLIVVSQLTQSWKAIAFVLTVTGGFHAFFFVTDGAEMLAFPLLLIALYFVCLHTPRRRDKIKFVILFLIVYFSAFCGTIIIKQILSIMVLGFEQVYKEFLEIVKLRLAGNIYGTPITIAKTLEFQFGYYLNELLYLKELYYPLMYTSMAAWTIGLGVLIFRIIESPDGICIDGSVFVVAGLIVILRYVVMREHSYEHAVFVCRYMFVFFASGWSLFFYMIHQMHVIKNSTKCPVC